MSQVIDAKKKKSLISKILSKHGISGDAHDLICQDLEGFSNHQAENMKMLERRIATMTQEIDHYKNELEKNQEKMIKQSKMSTIGEVTATLSHEINNRLMALNANCELIELINTNKLNNPSIAKSLVGVNESLDAISSLIKNIRKFSFHSSGDEDLTYNLDSPKSLISQALNISNALFKNSRTRLDLDCKIDDDFKSFMPSSELGQVLLNLLKNSFDHVMTLDNEHRWIRVSGKNDDKTVSISIINAGTIPAEVKKELFQPFFTTKEIGKGTGIGLSLSKKILKGMKGRVFLDESVTGEICFSIEFPIYQNDPTEIIKIEKPQAA